MARHHGTRQRKRKLWHAHKKRLKSGQLKNRVETPKPKTVNDFDRPQKTIHPERITQGESRHHCIPQSRRGPDIMANIRWKPHKEHTAWHILFANMTPKEVIQLIKKNPLEQILHLNGSNRHYENRQWAWNMIFTAHRAISRKDCIRIVQQDWTPLGLSPSIRQK